MTCYDCNHYNVCKISNALNSGLHMFEHDKFVAFHKNIAEGCRFYSRI